jgi:DNA-binding transcriptional LysR family regulator
MPSLRILRTFLAVAAEGSFTAAGQRVALTQVAVGLQMRTLENDLKRKLFARRASWSRSTSRAGRWCP